MPAKVKVKIISGRNLPVMDRSSDTTDAYVELKLGNTTYKTDVCRKSLHPQWNTDWYRFEVDDSELQDEPLQIRLMDHDTYSANDAIGKVYLDLNPLLIPASGNLSKLNDSNLNDNFSNSIMSGWIPVYDTMHGIRGEVNIIVKVELFSDFNRFRQSSCGVQFFCSPSIPYGHYAQTIQGFVEELVVNDDPEYQWIDKIRTPRASNEARQTLFFKLSGELQRKIGLKALELGGNAVIGYCQCFDLEGESGIVARGIGTAVTLVKIMDVAQGAEIPNEELALSYLKFVGSPSTFRLYAESAKFPFPTTLFIPHAKYAPNPLTQVENHSQKLRPAQSNPTLTDVTPRYNFKGLLQQEDMRSKPSRGFSQKLKNFRLSSQNLLSKKMTALKAKLGDGIEEIDEETIMKCPSDIKKKRQFFKRTVSDSSVMAELLARSVIQAHNSLTSILESQDQEHDNSQNTMEKLEPLADLIAKTSSEPNLSLDEDPAFELGSSSSGTTSDDDNYDDETFSASKDTIEVDTLSSIIKNVEILEKENISRKRISKQMSLPSLPIAELNSEFDGIYDPFIFVNYDQEVTNDVVNRVDDIAELEESKLQIPSDASDSNSSNDVSDYMEPNIVQEMKGEISQNASDISRDPKLILPPVVLKADMMQPKHLVKTAMNTILLEKANIMGTYTPPMSPTSSETERKVFNPVSEVSSANSSPPSRRSLKYASDIRFPRSCTSSSLSDYEKNRDSVLGAPFASMCNIRSGFYKQRSSHPVTRETVLGMPFQSIHKEMMALKQKGVTCLSDSELNRNINELEELVKNPKVQYVHKNRLKNLRNALLKRDCAFSRKGSLKCEHSEAVLGKGHFNFLRRKSHDPKCCSYGELRDKEKSIAQNKRYAESVRQSKVKAISSDNLTKRISSIFHKGNKKVDDEMAEFKKRGLVGSALGNVVRETVQDILATSRAPSKPKSPIILKNATPSPSVNVNLPSSMELNNGSCSNSNNIHASLTSIRNNTSSPRTETQPDQQKAESFGTKTAHSPAKLNSITTSHRRSSDSDLSITPKGNSLTGSDRSAGNTGYFLRNNAMFRTPTQQENFDMLEYPFLTMTKYPPGFVIHLGGAVSARSVKLLERISNLEEPESRDTWWCELRMEIRSHARTLNCNAVLGYTETTTICEDVCVLSASGTAAVIGFQGVGNRADIVAGVSVVSKHPTSGKEIMTASLDRNDFEKERNIQKPDAITKTEQGTPEHENSSSNCTICHLPYNVKNVPIRCTVLQCSSCRSGKVPDVLIATIEPPDGIPTIGRGCFLQAHICRPLKDLRGETNAKEISDGLPFLEYELHRLLVNKLKIKGMNAIFALKIRISIGDRMLIGLATGTAMFLSSLHIPAIPKLVSDRPQDERKLADLQKRLNDTVKRNREIYRLTGTDEFQSSRGTEEDSDSESPLELSVGNKDCCILEVDDPDDAEVLILLMEERPPDGFHVVNTENVPGLEDLEIVKNLQMFTQIYRAKIQGPFNLAQHFQRLLQSVYFKLRRMVPCALCNLQFRVVCPESDEIQLTVIGMALGLGDPPKVRCVKKKNPAAKHDELMIFKMEEDNIPENSVVNQSTYTHMNAQNLKYRQKSPLRNKSQGGFKARHVPHQERHGVDITPLSYVPGGKIERYLGNLNFFFIRETTSIREEGGLSGFIHSFVTEVLAIVRAHVTALGGNAMVAYFMTECVLNYNLHKNQGQCLINVGGDVVFVSYFKEE